MRRQNGPVPARRCIAHPRRPLVALVVVAIIGAGCGDDSRATDTDPTDAAAPGDARSASAPTSSSVVEPGTHDPAPGSPWPAPPRNGEVSRWTVEVVDRIDHDPTAFTQGLEVVDGVGYESTGRRGESTIRRFDPVTGEIALSVPLDVALFGEGLTLAGDRLLQVTFTSGTGFVRDPDDLAVVDTFGYDGEGWGVCASDPDSFWLSDGTATLRRLDTEDFGVIERVEVSGEGLTVGQLNELECVDGLVLANMWHRDDIAVIDPARGEVVALVDASSLAVEVAPAVAGDDQNVLNGIAALDDGTFLLTGKRWPTLFRVRLVEA